MAHELQLAITRTFNGIQFDCYRDESCDDDFFATREQIGLLLEYSEPDKAIRNIHSRNKERLDKFSTGLKLRRVEGSRTVTREMTVYSFKGLLEVCRYSNQPKANDVMDFLWNVADEIRRTGSYGVNRVNRTDLVPTEHTAQLEMKKRELDIKGAEILKAMLDAPAFPLTDESKAVIGHEIVKLITGKEMIMMLPAVTEQWYSATDIGQKVGLSPSKVGSIANQNGLKPPVGESNEYGRWIYSKSRYSNKEVPTFVYNERGLKWFMEYAVQNSDERD